QHVVRREVLAPRVREVHGAPLRAELLKLLLYELRRGRRSVEVVSVGEEKSLERQLLGAEAGDGALVGRRGEIRLLRELHLVVPLARRDLGDRTGTRRHLDAGEPLG